MPPSNDPLAFPRACWQGLGWLVGHNPLLNRADVDILTGAFLRQADSMRGISPVLSAVTEQMAAEFHGAALDALTKRP